MYFKVLFFVASLVLGRKKNLLLISFMVLTISSPLKWGTLDLFLCSNVTHHSIGNKHHDRTLTYARFSIHITTCHTTDLKLLPIFAAHVHIWWNVLTANYGHRVKFTAQMKKMNSKKDVCMWKSFLFKGSEETKFYTWNYL